MPSNEKIEQLRGDNSDFLENRQKAGEEYRQQAKEAGDRIKQTTASKVLRGAISGPIKAVNEAVEFGDDIYDYFAGNPYDNNDLIDIGKLGLEVEGDKEDWTYTVPQAVTQFLLPMGLVSGATRKAITNPWARNLLAGAVTDAVVQDPYEENLFNMLDKVPWLASPVTEILKAKTEEEIGVAEARLRQTGGGALLGETVTGVALGLKQLKKAPKAVQERILKRLMNDENTRLVHATSDNIDNLGDEIIPDKPKKISERLRENLKNVAQSDARALKETDELLKEVSEITGSKQLPDSPKIGTQIPRGETAQSGAVFIERVDKGTGQTGPIAKAFNLPNTYDLAVLELQELNATQLAELGIKKADIAKLSPRKTINLLKKNFDNVRKDLLPGEYRMEGYSESRRKLYKKWFKDDPDVNWVDRQTGKASTIDDEMSIPYLTVKEQPPKLDLTTDTRGKGEFYHGAADEFELDSSSHYSARGLYGQGLYTTDDLTTAGKYQKKNKARKPNLSTDYTWSKNPEADYQRDLVEFNKKPQQQTIYKITEKQPVKFFDLDQPVTQDIIEKLEEIQGTYEGYDEVIGRTFDEFKIGSYNKSTGKNPSLAQIIDEIRANNKANTNMSIDELDNITVDLEEFLRGKGFGGFTHQGGKKAGKGKRLHQVKIYWDPQDQLDINKVDAGGGGAVPPRKPPSGSSGADVPPVDPTDPKVQTTFNPKFTGGGDPDVQKLILDAAEENKRLDAEGLWPHKRTFKDMVNSANELLPKEVIDQARLFNARYGRGGEDDLPAILIAMNQQMNKNATALYDIAKAMDQSLAAGNKEGFAELKEQLIRETKILDGLITLNKPLKTVPAQTLAANKAGGGVGNQAATIEDLASRTPAEKATDQAVDVRGVVEDSTETAVEQKTIKEILDAAEQGDKPAMKKLRTITKRLQAASGNPEALRRMAQEGPIIKGLRVSNEIFINSILSGPETHAVNILSTALNTIARPIEQVAGAAVTGNTQGMMRGAKELIYLTQSIGDSLKMAKAAFRIEDNIINPGAMIQDASRFNVRMDGEGTLANIINTFGTIQRLPSRFLLAEDEFFKSMNFRAYVKASAWENGVNKGLDGKQLKTYIQDQFDKTIGIVNEGSMKNTKNIEIAELYEKAQQYAAETTFTADLPAGSFGKKLQGLASHPAGRIFLPFVRTPLNIFKTQVRRTPGVNMILQEYRQALRSSDPSIAARARGEMVIGGAVWSVAAVTAYSINDDFSELAITGGGPSNYDLLNQKKATGWQPYSFRFIKKDKNGQVIMGKDGRPSYKYVSFKRLDPWSSFLMMAADAAAITGQVSQQDRDDFGVAASVALGRNITNKTYLQGITELSDLLQKPYKLESWLARRAAATVNPFSSLGRSGSKYFDPTIMDKRVRAGDDGMVILRKFHNELASTIPGYGAGMRPIRNFITGSLVEYPPGYGPDIMNIMNPIKETNSLNHAVLTNLVEIGAKIPQPSDNLPFGKRLDGSLELSGVKLNKDQYADYVEEISFVKIGGVPLVRALYNQMQMQENKALLATAKGENIKTDNQDTAVDAQEVARGKLELIFKDTISKYKKAGRIVFLQKNPELALEYARRKAEIKQIVGESALENLKQLQGATN